MTNRTTAQAFLPMRLHLSALALSLLALTAQAQDPALDQALARQAEAEALHKTAEKERAAAEQAQESGMLACNAKFLVNNCKQKVRAEYIERIGKVREMEIRANAMEREARTAEVEIRDRERAAAHAVAPAQASSTQRPASSPRTELQPRPAEARAPRHAQSAPPPASPQAAAAAEATRQRAQAANRNRTEAEKQAAARAERARADAARYDERAKKHAEKLARENKKPAAE